MIAEHRYSRVDGPAHETRRFDTATEMWDRVPRCVKLLGSAPWLPGDELLAAARAARLPGVEVCHSGGHGLVELSAERVSKAATLARWCAARGVAASEVVAFGDMPNDVPLLRWAGRSYAVDNAHPEAMA
ncbi:MAG: HAD family hydrolase, partial [Stackebrandtia sp.]